MSIFGDIANAVSGAVNFVADAVSSAAEGVAELANGPLGSLMDLGMMAASFAFPPAGIANALSNFVTSGVGDAVMKAVDQLCKESGLPKFLGDAIKDCIKDIVNDECGGKPTTPKCGEAVNDKCDGLKGLFDDFIKDLIKFVKDKIGGEDGDCNGGGPGKGGKGGKTSAGSWLEAIAEAMGKAAGKQAEKMVELSQKLDDLSSKSGEGGQTGEAGLDQQKKDAAEMAQVNSQFQAASQMFNILQNSFSNAIKSIGEGISTMARKG